MHCRQAVPYIARVMDISWLGFNLANAWRYRLTSLDAIVRLYFTYQHRLPESLRRREFVIGYHYDEPIGTVRLLMRANGGADGFIHSEVFEHQYYDLKLDTTPLTILDLGANVGFTAIYFGRVYPQARIACVEPVPRNLRSLKRNLEMNQVQAEVIEAAVDTKDGMVSMQLLPADYGHKVIGSIDTQSNDIINVPSISIPSLLHRLCWDRIDLMKIDIEGHEKILFSERCEWLRVVETVCIECHDGFEMDLPNVAERYGFAEPIRLPGIWVLRRTRHK